MRDQDINEDIGKWMQASHSQRDALFRLIERLRLSGATWVQIGNAMGTTPQAAQQRFGKQ